MGLVPSRGFAAGWRCFVGRVSHEVAAGSPFCFQPDRHDFASDSIMAFEPEIDGWLILLFFTSFHQPSQCLLPFCPPTWQPECGPMNGSEFIYFRRDPTNPVLLLFLGQAGCRGKCSSTSIAAVYLEASVLCDLF